MSIRYAQMEDEAFWFSYDRHISKAEFFNKVRDKRAYILLEDGKPIGLLRYNHFWDNTPFCNLLMITAEHRAKGNGKRLMEYWECDMKSQGYGMLFVSTQADETAQHFYRKLGYRDCGGIVIDIPEYAQPMELFFLKSIL